MSKAADDRYIAIAHRHGVRETIAADIVRSCRKHHLPISTGFALFDHESTFRNIFGHDPTNSIPDDWKGTQVTTDKYHRYKRNRGSRGQGGMQGVGCGQLTWYETQDLADKRGGCQHSNINIDVAVETLAARIKQFGYVKGIERYNGTGLAAIHYSVVLRALSDMWHHRLSS